MNTEKLLYGLLDKGMVVWAEGDKFRFTVRPGALTQEMREQIVAHKSEIMNLLGQNCQYAVCSFAQQRLWFLYQWAPESATYNISSAVRLTGVLGVAALERSLAQIVQRHATLRTTFATLDGNPVQVANQTATLTLSHVDMESPDEVQREIEARQFALAEAQRPFNLETGPLLRAYLLQIAPQYHILILTMHHIVSDGWSMGVFIRELSALYRAGVAGTTARLEDLPLQYTEFAIWQRQWLQGDALEEQLAYWKHHLTPEPPLLNLPLDYPRPPVQTSRGAAQPLQLAPELCAALKALSQQEGVTLFMTLLSAFYVLLYRYSGQTDIAVGTPIANRNRPEIENLIGFFVNTLVLRVDLSDMPSFRVLLQRVREITIEAYAHQDIPFERLVEELQPQRSLSHTPLFQVMFAFQNVAAQSLDLPGLTLELLNTDSETTKFEMSLSLSQTARTVVGELTYNTDLFDAATIGRFLGHFETLLMGVVAAPEQPIAALPLLTEAERHSLRVWNSTVAAYPDALCLHELFEAQVQRAPEAPAAVYGDQVLSYQDLNRRANQLAHHLRGLGVGPEVLVGVCMERSPELLVGLLGVLKAGGAYVPLDVMYPQERLAFMLQDSGAAVALTQARWEGLLPAGTRRVIRLDADWETIAQEPDENPRISVAQENLAYVIYTSGSTGRPKGAAILHQGLVNYLRWCERAYPLAEGCGAPVHSSISFDLTVTSIFAPLLTGRQVHLLPEDFGIDALLMALRNGVEYSLVKITPVHLNLLAQQLSPEEASGRTRAFIIGGENLLAEHIAFWQTHAPETLLVNEYGPTETVVGCCVYQVPVGKVQSSSVPIGQPIINTQLYILDIHLNPVPVGVAGELYIGGAGLARGYHKQPGLTAEKFVPDPIGLHPFGAAPGARLYRTGDLARRRPDGNIEFLGRVDHQVKVRGFRIEIGEIETVLEQHPAVRKAVVLAREDRRGDNRLVAYVVACDGNAPTVAAMRSFLQATLPDYMIPSAFVMLDAIPLTSNGKVDRRALPAPDGERPTLETAYAAPRTPTEAILADIWGTLLGVERVGIHDDFFALGGHSLLATQVTSRLRDALGVEVPLRELFAHSSVADLAAVVDALRAHVPNIVAPPLRRVERSTALPLSYAQQRLWFLDQLEPGSAAYNVPAALRLSGTLDVAALERSFNRVVARHEALRTTFSAVKGEPLQVIAPEMRFNISMIDLSEVPAREQEAAARDAARADARAPFDLQRGPLLRVTLLRLGMEEHVLLLNIHHIVSDAWSTGVLVRELAEFYRGEVVGVVVHLPELPLQYADYAVWQREWLQGEALESQFAYWKEKLGRGLAARGPAALELPTDRPRPAVQTFVGDRRARPLSLRLVTALKTLGREENATLFMTLLAVFKVLLYRYTGQTDIAVGSPIANRTRSEMEGVIGFFVNTQVLRSDLSGNPTFRELLRQVKTTALEAYAYQDLPFEMLVEAIQPARDMSRSPLFQVMFVLQNAPGGDLALPGLTLSGLDAPTGTAKFDLLLFTQETPQGLWLSAEYNTDLFDAGRIERLLGHFETLLEGVIAGPEQRIAALPLLMEEELAQLQAWNAAATIPTPIAPLHAHFAAQAARTPEAVAVSCPERDERLTYRELEQRSNQLAHYLRGLGVGPDAPVALSIPRSLEMAVAVLGVLKAGGAYLPLDPAYPQARLAFMLADAGAAVLLTLRESVGQLPPFAGRMVCVDAEWGAIAAEPDTPLPETVSVENLAYIIYTSGSTGQPKGVAMRHAPLVNLVAWQAQATALNRAERTLQFASLSFDVSCQEMFSTWLLGGELVLVEEETRRDALALLAFLAREKVERLYLPFVALQHLAEAATTGGAARAEDLRQLVTAGEQLRITPQIVAWLKGMPECTLHNQYGPSESHVITAQTLEGQPESWGLLPPIGRPIANARTYVLDGALQAAPVGVTGELYLGGEAVLARGYYRRAGLTAERFVPDPFDTAPGARMYKTGDRARWLADGTLDFLGRADDQVKVRGYRIELGEVEAALDAHPGVRGAAAAVHGEDATSRQLAAYLVPEPGEGVSVESLRTFLQGRLPDYMIPARFVFLESLPLTPSGKVDRRALPEPDIGGVDAGAFLVAPRDALELRLTQIWEAVLGVRPIGVTHDFFALGGHSLLAVRLISRIQQDLDRVLPLAVLFQHPTIESLAAVLRQQGGKPPSTSSLVLMQSSDSTRSPLFLVHPAGGNVLCYTNLVRYLGPDQPCYGFQAQGLFFDRLPHTHIEAMAQHYLALLREVLPEGPYLLGGWSMGGLVAYEMARQLHPQEVRLLLIDTGAPSRRTRMPDDLALLGSFARDLGLSLEPDVFAAQEFHALPSQERLAWILERAREASLIPPDVTPEQVQHLIQVFKSNVQAMAAYRPHPYAGPALLIQAADQIRKAPLLSGWKSLLTGAVAVKIAPGDHYTLVREPHVRALAEFVAQYINGVRSKE